MTIYAYDSGVWKEVIQPYVSTGDEYLPCEQVYVYENGWVRLFGPDPAAVQIDDYKTPGSYTYTVPDGAELIKIECTGGGGSGSHLNSNDATNDGSDGGASSATGTGIDVDAEGGRGGSKADDRGNATATGANLVGVQLTQRGGFETGPRNRRGGESFYGEGGYRNNTDNSSSAYPATPTFGAGGGGGQDRGFSSRTEGGDAGGTAIAVYSVTPGQTIDVVVGAGGPRQGGSATRGASSGNIFGKGGSAGYTSYSRAGAGGKGRVVITTAGAVTDVFTYDLDINASSPLTETKTFVVPASVYSITVTAVGGGGGAGAANAAPGEVAFVGGGGGSGGFEQDLTFDVTPGEILTMTIGRGGFGASARDNDFFDYNPLRLALGFGETGGDTTLTREDGTSMMISTGGGRGGPGLGVVTGPAAGGSPDGRNGQESAGYDNGGFGFTGKRSGGTNPNNIGNGGDAVGIAAGGNGGNGRISISYQRF